MIGIVNASVSPDMKKLIIYLLLFGVFQLNAEKRPFLPKPPKPDKPEVDKSNFGQWLDKDGYITEGPKIKNWIDTDRDRIDDRLQAGPGKPAGKKRPDVVRPKPEPKPKPKPVRPTKPTRPNTEENKPTRPQRPSRPELPTELKDKMGAYKKEQDAIRAELKEAIGKIDKPTREKVKEAIAAFNEANKERLDANKNLAKSIKEGLNENRPERPKKPEPTEEVKVLQKAHAEKIKELHDGKKKLMTELREASDEDKKQLIDAFKSQQKDLHEELKNIQRQLREQIEVSKKPMDGAKPKQRTERRPPPRPKTDLKKGESRRPTNR